MPLVFFAPASSSDDGMTCRHAVVDLRDEDVAELHRLREALATAKSACPSVRDLRAYTDRVSFLPGIPRDREFRSALSNGQIAVVSWAAPEATDNAVVGVLDRVVVAEEGVHWTTEEKHSGIACWTEDVPWSKIFPTAG